MKRNNKIEEVTGEAQHAETKNDEKEENEEMDITLATNGFGAEAEAKLANGNPRHQTSSPTSSAAEAEIKLGNGNQSHQTSTSSAVAAETEVNPRNSDPTQTQSPSASGTETEVKQRNGSPTHQYFLLRSNSRCRSSCEGLKKGRKYQSCQGCRFFLHCPHKGRGHVKRCHGDRVWDDVSHRCMNRSRTCTENANSGVLTKDKINSNRSVSEPRILTLSIRGSN